MYSLVASVVRKDGLLNRMQNTMIGWTCAAIIVVMNLAFHYKDYGSSFSYLATGSHYHCWLDYQTGILVHLHHHHDSHVTLHRPAVRPDAPLVAAHPLDHCCHRGFWGSN